ncbi:hypothetical protein GGX14DRAFT_560705 [Mycena pura]|uniref:Uncharacterized protein n=1 Tax=Mycena pura TaxID=153505 RepID=A0AAD6VNH0_9AGAR|nr:hypothetical protein GGX14DRAFT_560705 [Mycena pura]
MQKQIAANSRYSPAIASPLRLLSSPSLRACSPRPASAPALLAQRHWMFPLATAPSGCEGPHLGGLPSGPWSLRLLLGTGTLQVDIPRFSRVSLPPVRCPSRLPKARKRLRRERRQCANAPSHKAAPRLLTALAGAHRDSRYTERLIRLHPVHAAPACAGHSQECEFAACIQQQRPGQHSALVSTRGPPVPTIPIDASNDAGGHGNPESAHPHCCPRARARWWTASGTPAKRMASGGAYVRGDRRWRRVARARSRLRLRPTMSPEERAIAAPRAGCLAHPLPLQRTSAPQQQTGHTLRTSGHARGILSPLGCPARIRPRSASYGCTLSKLSMAVGDGDRRWMRVACARSRL